MSMLKCSCVCVCVCVYFNVDVFVLEVLQLKRKLYPDMSLSQFLHSFVKGGILNTYSYEEKRILNCLEIWKYIQLLK